MFHDCAARLQELAGDLLPIRQTAERLIDSTARLDSSSGSLLIGHRPARAPEAYAVVLFPGIPEQTITAYEQLGSGNVAIPKLYRQVLYLLNGANLFGISLYGVPGSLARTPPLLDRSARQPLDVGTANARWKLKYRPGSSQFHFGNGPYSRDENVGYFLNADDTVEARRSGGETFGRWSHLGEFLEREIARAESLFPT